jgi:uncharacterized membrane protein YraQ (UPF0718 family)
MWKRGWAMFTYILYVAAGGLLLLSFFKDRQKTKKALMKAWKSFENILPQFLSVLLIIGIMLSILDEKMISSLLGKESGLLGMAIAAVIGSITLIPGFVAFPLAASLLKAGAGYGQITMLLTTLMMVGVVTLPVESKFFGKKMAVRRNIFAFVFAVCASFIIGGIIG